LDSNGETNRATQRQNSVIIVVLGPEHPDTALSLNNLADALDALVRAGEAKALRRYGVTPPENPHSS